MLDKVGPWSRAAIFTGGAIVLVAAGALIAHLLTSSGAVIPAADKQPAQNSAAVPVIGDMVLERQFHGPLKDTVVQRYRDPKDGTICYIYLPILVQHTPLAANGMVQYGANGIGSISCVPGR